MKLLAIAIVLGLGSGAFSLRCWNCKNANSNQQCNAEGRVETCSTNEACVNQEKTSADGSTYRITKSCRKKTARACRRRDPQNVGSYPTNCMYNEGGSTCECCCETDMCNSPQTECKDAITCRKPDNPGNGRIRCPKSIKFGTKCSVKCMPGYVRNGPSFITCVNGTDQGYFSPRETVSCLAKTSRPVEAPITPDRCKALKVAPAHGSMVCENRGDHRDKRTYDYRGSVCAFRCDPGYFLRGQESTRCLSGGRWSTKMPTCQKGVCQRPGRDINRVDTCTDGFHFGTVCNARCKDGFRLVGERTSICSSINDRIRQGRWSNQFPRCVRALCIPQLTAPTNGGMKCSKRNRVGTWCTFTCNDGYELTDLSLTNDGIIQCLEAGDKVEWDGVPPKCTLITCPRLAMPENGNIACVGDGRVGSKCTFRCHAGFDLVGSSNRTLTTECISDGNGDAIGLWTVDSVNCAPIRCQPERTSPENGEVYCTSGNSVGSICTYTCNEGYDMDNTIAKVVTNVCEPDDAGDGIGKWSENEVSCSTRYYCPVTQTNPEHGSVTCDNDAYLGSVCQFSCDEGYELRGIDRITCRDLSNDGDAEVEWSNPAPTCVGTTCPEQWFDSSKTTVTCNRNKEGGAYSIGTECRYECSDVGYYLESMEGEGGVVTCIAKNTWSRAAAPRCYTKSCPALEKIDNGNKPDCTDGNSFGSQCRYKCNDRYSLSHDDPLICQASGRDGTAGFWDIQPPECTLNECEAVPAHPRKGTVTCSSGAKLGSYCTLQCERGHVPRITRVDCILTRETVNGEAVDVPRFPQLDDFCCARCLSEFHVVLAVDARSQTGLQNVLNFATILLSQLEEQDNAVQFSAFAYDTQPQRLTVIEKTALTSRDDIQRILEQMEAWKTDEEEKTSNTRGAIEFARSTMFTPVDTITENFLIVAADDSPDNVRPRVISQLNDISIKVIAAPSNNFSKIKWERLLPRDRVVDQDANEIINKMYDLAFTGGCSNIASECV